LENELKKALLNLIDKLFESGYLQEIEEIEI
jgi:hypothetical protein